MSDRQQQFERILLWLRILKNLTQPFFNIVSGLISIWSCWIIFTRCKSTVFNWDLWRIYLDEPKKCPFIGSLVYTALIYAIIDLLHKLCQIFALVFKTWEFIHKLLNSLQYYRTVILWIVHFLFLYTWHNEKMKFEDPQTEVLTLCRDNFMSVTLTEPKNSNLQDICIESLYNSMFWVLLCFYFSISIIVSSTLVRLLLNILN